MAKVNDIPFSDIYVMPDKVAYIPDGRTESGLQVIQPEDFEAFYSALENTWDKKNPSYSLFFENRMYRVERTMSIYGQQFVARKMPVRVPSFADLGFPVELTKYLLSLGKASGLLLWAGPTGSGKTTSISSLMKEYLNMEGGFAYTIEDPAEQPLDGVYKSMAGGLGLCKQTLPPDGNWGDGLKSALRSKPRYIMVGEIRTPDTASEVLRAATSGHLVLSTIHANNVTDAINAIVKYASSKNMSEELAYDLFSRGLLGIVHQTISGVHNKVPNVSFLFANPDSNKGDQVRGIIKTGSLNLSTAIEIQEARLKVGKKLFAEI